MRNLRPVACSKCAKSHIRRLSAFAPIRDDTLKYRVIQENNPPPPRAYSDPKSTIDLVMTLLPPDSTDQPLANDSEKRVLQAFKVGQDSMLSIPQDHRLPSPYSYFTTVNGDESYITQPRLSVTKVLTKAWCELRAFYEVFSGSPKLQQSERMRTGSEYHLELEKHDHPTIDLAILEAQVAELAQGLPEEKRREFEDTFPGFNLCSSWLEQTVNRALVFGHRNHSRELFVHGFLDLKSMKLVTEAEDLEEAVLVNGIADVVAVSGTPSTDDGVHPRFAAQNELRQDLKYALPEVKAQLRLSPHLEITDIKTRERNSVPPQASVIDAAKLQCMYYGQFLHNLSRDAVFAYKSCVENSRRRGLDPDAPISELHAVSLLVANFGQVANDFLRLAKGEPIGFEAFDTWNHTKRDFSLGSVISEPKLREILAVHYENVDIDLSPLFKDWEIPLTPRYVAARCGQAFNVFEATQTTSVCVEYHNVRSKSLIAKKEFAFDGHELQRSIEAASEFWSGQRPPVPTEDFSKCNYCDFKRRCPALNGEKTVREQM